MIKSISKETILLLNRRNKSYTIENKTKRYIFPKLTIPEGRNHYHDVNVILTHYHILCDTYLGLGIFYVIIIYCGFIEFSKAMDLPWYPYIVLMDQPIHYSGIKCK